MDGFENGLIERFERLRISSVEACDITRLRISSVIGSTSYDGGTFTVRGAGVDLTVNNQGMTGQFLRQPVTGDCTLTARLVSRTGATADRVGLLMAKSLSPFDQAAGVIVTGGTSGIEVFT